LASVSIAGGPQWKVVESWLIKVVVLIPVSVSISVCHTHVAGPAQNNSKNKCHNFRGTVFFKKKICTLKINIHRNGIYQTLFLEEKNNSALEYQTWYQPTVVWGRFYI
jgi:hypothetical protein